VTQQGRLLIFPVDELPALARGKGNKLIQIPTKDLMAKVDALLFVGVISGEYGQTMKILSGKRHLKLKAVDIEHYGGNRARRGLFLPQGFKRVDGLTVE